jgi:hypothetical protein
MLVEIFYELEIVDHDDYCVGQECNYIKIQKSVVVEYEPQSDDCQDLSTKNWEGYLPVPHVNDGGTGYCYVPSQASRVGMNHPHEYRYTILSVEVIGDHE